MSVDLSELFTMVFQWLFYPITNWSFSIWGYSFTISKFFEMLCLFGMCMIFLKCLAGEVWSNIKFINLFFGDGE